MAANVLVIDGDPATLQAVELALDHIGCSVRCAIRDRRLLTAIVRDPPDLLVAGINDDEHDWPFYHELLGVLDVPLFLLLASNQQADRIRGLEMGAMDCVSKGECSPVELAARLRAVLRRTPPQPRRRRPAWAFVDGELAIDLNRQEVWLAGELVSLTPTEFCILACLARHAGSALPYDLLLAEVWGRDHDREPSALRPHIHSLRQKLEPDPARPRRIVNRRGKGYLLQSMGA